MIDKSLVASLSDICPGGVHVDVSLADISRWKIGGSADIVVEPKSVGELCQLRSFISKNFLSSVVVGEASNLLFADEGLRAICIKIGQLLANVAIDGTTVRAEAGIWVPRFSRLVMQAGLTGAEHICGIPGTLGGLICMNGGSQRKGIGNVVVEVTAVSPSGELLIFDHDACRFAYRTSVFQNNGVVLASAKLVFSEAKDRTTVRQEMLSILRERSRKFPRKQPNCGSVFKSNPAMYSVVGPPGLIVEELGLKGLRIGDAAVSPHHGNFFINIGKARSVDMLRLIKEVSSRVYAATGFRMEAEVRFVTPQGNIISADSRY